MRILFIRYYLEKNDSKLNLYLRVTHKINRINNVVNVISFFIFYFLFCVFYFLLFILCILLISGCKRPPSVDVSRCKRPLVWNVVNPSRETTPLLRPPHFDLGGGLK